MNTEDTNKRKGKTRRRPGRPPTHETDLSIAIRESLRDTGRNRHKRTSLNKPSLPTRPRSSNSVTSSSGSSSRSCSPNIDEQNSNDDQKTNQLIPSAEDNCATNHEKPIMGSGSSDKNNAFDLPNDFSSTSDLSPSTGNEPLPLQSHIKLPATNGHDFLAGIHDRCILDDKSGFLDLLYQFMQKRQTPIGRIPSLGFKKREFVLRTIYLSVLRIK